MPHLMEINKHEREYENKTWSYLLALQDLDDQAEINPLNGENIFLL